jgi:hypothetical protein
VPKRDLGKKRVNRFLRGVLRDAPRCGPGQDVFIISQDGGDALTCLLLAAEQGKLWDAPPAQNN